MRYVLGTVVGALIGFAGAYIGWVIAGIPGELVGMFISWPIALIAGFGIGAASR